MEEGAQVSNDWSNRLLRKRVVCGDLEDGADLVRENRNVQFGFLVISQLTQPTTS